MKSSLLFFVAIAVLTACNDIHVNRTTVSKIDSLFIQLEQDGLFNGEVLVSTNGEISFHKSFGYKSFETKTRFTQNSIFEIASITKPFTALAIAKLVSDSKIEYSDLVKIHIPELPYDSITIKQLVNHTSGLPDYAQVLYPNWDYTRIADNNALLAILVEKEPELIIKPGTAWKYSNIGYVLLAIVIERVSGKSYPKYLQEELFNSLGMNHTITPSYEEALQLEDYVDDYVYTFGNAEYVDPKIWPSFDNVTFTADMYGAAGICTNALDLLKFTGIFNAQTIMSDSVFKSYLKPQNIKTSMSDYFASGLFYDNDNVLGPTYFHVGGFAGYRSLVQYYTETQTAIVILSNTSTTPIWKIKEMVGHILSDTEIQYPKKSLVRLISKTMQQNEYNIRAFRQAFDFDTSQYRLLNYELDELLDDYSLAKKDSLNIVVLKKIQEYYPNDESITDKLEQVRKTKM